MTFGFKFDVFIEVLVILEIVLFAFDTDADLKSGVNVFVETVVLDFDLNVGVLILTGCFKSLEACLKIVVLFISLKDAPGLSLEREYSI